MGGGPYMACVGGKQWKEGRPCFEWPTTAVPDSALLPLGESPLACLLPYPSLALARQPGQVLEFDPATGSPIDPPFIGTPVSQTRYTGWLDWGDIAALVLARSVSHQRKVRHILAHSAISYGL